MNRTPALENNITEIMPVGRPRAIVSSRDVAYVATGVALMTVCAWISIPVGDVPFTLQTFAVSVIGMLLGWKRGFASVAIYILAGLVGIPVFAGFRAGVQAIAGPHNGRLCGNASRTYCLLFVRNTVVSRRIRKKNGRRDRSFRRTYDVRRAVYRPRSC